MGGRRPPPFPNIVEDFWGLGTSWGSGLPLEKPKNGECDKEILGKRAVSGLQIQLRVQDLRYRQHKAALRFGLRV